MNYLCTRCEADRRKSWPAEYKQMVDENAIDRDLFDQLVAEEMVRWKDTLERLAKGPMTD